MFLTVTQMSRDMGVDPRIARFFVDRRVPADNRFWTGRLLYIGTGNGFVSIPVFYDLLLRLGVPPDAMLNETHVSFMERLMHFAIAHEYHEIGKEEELTSIRTLLAGRVKNQARYAALNRYHDQSVLRPLEGFGTEWPALNRADVYLYVLCDLPLTEKQWERGLEAWYALHPSYLIMDDIKDYRSDLAEGEENVILSWGGGKAGFDAAFEKLEVNYDILAQINPVLAGFYRSHNHQLLNLAVG